jgi:hypothetical protein
MKKTAFISLLGVALLLTGCDANLTKVKKPNFASFGDEVAFEDFKEDLTKALETIDFNQEARLGSKEAKIKSAEASSQTLYRYNGDEEAANYKVIKQNINGSLTNGTIKYDAKKLISIIESKQKNVEIIKSRTEDSKEESTTETSSGSAVVTIDSGKSEISFNNKAMTYSVTKSFGEGEEPADYIDSTMKLLFMMGVEFIFATNLPTDSIYTPSKYHFYENKNRFTYTYTETINQDLKDYSNVIYAHSTKEYKNTFQLEVSDNKQILTAYRFTKETIDYLRDYEGAHANERSVVSSEVADELTLKSKNVSLNSVKLSKYTEIE